MSWRQNQQNIGTGLGQSEEPGLQMQKCVHRDVISLRHEQLPDASLVWERGDGFRVGNNLFG